MNKYVLTKGDFELYNKLISASKLIHGLYKKLESLELEGKKDSDEFSKTIDVLKKVLLDETALYTYFNNKSYVAEALIHHILTNEVKDDFLDDNASIADMDYIKCEERRILKKLYSIVYNNSPNFIEKIVGELSESFGAFGINLDNIDFNTEFKKHSAIEDAFEYDINMGYLVSLMRYLNNSFFDKEDILTSKYYTAYITPSIERVLVDNHFTIEDYFYTSAQFTSEVAGVDENVYSMFHMQYGLEFSSRIISEIINLELGDFNYKHRLANLLSFLRSSFMFLTTDEVLLLKKDFEDFIEDPQNYEKLHYNKAHIPMILDCFKNEFIYKSQQRIISTRPR